MSLLFVIPALGILAFRHQRGHPLDDPPTYPEVATWGAVGRPVEVEATSDEALSDDDADIDDEVEDEDPDAIEVDGDDGGGVRRADGSDGDSRPRPAPA